jgi:hypothetical protein
MSRSVACPVACLKYLTRGDDRDAHDASAIVTSKATAIVAALRRLKLGEAIGCGADSRDAGEQTDRVAPLLVFC